MCGIAGLIQKGSLSHTTMTSALNRMLDAMASRGPDSQGLFFSEDCQVALGHTRLAIIDQSSMGHQPMVSADKRLTISYNGELFGYQSLKAKLGQSFRGHSDTEVLLEYLSSQSNIEKAISQLDGMFAFALFNQSNNEVILVRDHLGIKPLYYYQNEDFLLFASEPWVIFSSGLVKAEISLELFPLLASVKMEAELEDTWYKGIKQLMPASILRFQVNTGQLTLKEYWRPSPEEFLFSSEQLSHAFSGVVRDRIPADVNRGAFLSGGVDSTAIVAELRKQGVDILPCVITYQQEAISEDFNHANTYAKAIGMQLKEIVVDPMKANLLGDGVNAVQRPIVHGGELGMLMAYQQMSQLGIKVCYSGHGADELWGYQDSDYFPLLSMAFTPDMHSEYYLRHYYFRKHHESWTLFLNQFIYPVFSVNQARMEAMSWERIFAEYRRAPFLDPYKKARYHMMKRFLLYVNNMVDRTSMYYSVEDRPVFQSMEMVKLAFALPEYIKNRQGIGHCKPFLKQAFSSLLPDAVLQRPKIGFQPPRHEQFRAMCLNILAEEQPLGLKIPFEKLATFPMNQLLFLASTQRILCKLNEFNNRFYRRD